MTGSLLRTWVCAHCEWQGYISLLPLEIYIKIYKLYPTGSGIHAKHMMLVTSHLDFCSGS